MRNRNKSQWLWILIVLLFVFGYFFVQHNNSIKLSPVEPTVQGTSTDTTQPSPSDKIWYEVYFTTPKIPFDNNYEGGIENHLIDKISHAQSSIDVAVFEFDIESVAQALIQAKDRGVDVRVVYDNENSDPDPQMGELRSAGIPTVPDERGAFMHNKFFVFDDQCIWTGSFNISMNAAYRNNENALYFCSPEAAKNYDTEFNEMFSGNFGPTSSADTPYPLFTVDGITIENYFAPEDHVMDQVVKVIETAKTSIHFMAYSFTDDDLMNAMLADAQRQVSVEGIFESTGADTKYSACGPLLQAGLDIRLDGNPRTFHHKVIIIDDKIVITGSFNFTANADESNDENLLIIHDPRLAQAYEDQYQLMKSQSVIPQNGICDK